MRDDRLHARKGVLPQVVRQGAGALVVGFSLAGSALAGKAKAAAQSDAPYVNIPGPPDPTQVDSWIVVHPDNTVTVFMGKVPNGTGTDTGTLQLAAEELSLPVSSVHIQNFDSGGANPAPSQAPTVGSNESQAVGRKSGRRLPLRRVRCWVSPRPILACRSRVFR